MWIFSTNISEAYNRRLESGWINLTNRDTKRFLFRHIFFVYFVFPYRNFNYLWRETESADVNRWKSFTLQENWFLWIFLHCYSPKKLSQATLSIVFLLIESNLNRLPFFENSIECNFHWYSDNGRMINIYYYPIYQLPVGPRMKVNCRFVYLRLRIVCPGII